MSPMMDAMKAMSHARMEMERVASAKGSPRMLLGRNFAILDVLSRTLGFVGMKIARYKVTVDGDGRRECDR